MTVSRLSFKLQRFKVTLRFFLLEKRFSLPVRITKYAKTEKEILSLTLWENSYGFINKTRFCKSEENFTDKNNFWQKVTFAVNVMGSM